MTRDEKLIAELRRALIADADARVVRLERRVRELEKQRDQWKARAAELREYANRYQRELGEERRKTPPPAWPPTPAVPAPRNPWEPPFEVTC